MIVIRVELWPGGDQSRRKTMAVGTITNIGGTAARGEYEACFYGAGNGASGDIEHVYEYLRSRGGRIQRSPWRIARVKDFARKREGAWALLLEALGAAMHQVRP